AQSTNPTGCSTCNSEVHLQRRLALASQHCQLSVAIRNVYSSSSTLLFTDLLNKSTRYASNKKPLYFRGFASLLHPLILRTAPLELAPFLQLCKRVAGFHRAVSLHLSG